MRPTFHIVQFAKSVNIRQRIRQWIRQHSSTTPTVGVAGRSPETLWGFWVDVSSLLDKQQAASLCGWSASMMPGPSCESLFPSDGSEGQSETEDVPDSWSFLKNQHDSPVSVFFNRCLIPSSYPPPTCHIANPGAKIKECLGVLLLTDGGDTINYAGAAAAAKAQLKHHGVSAPGGEACQIQQCQISQAPAQLYTSLIMLDHIVYHLCAWLYWLYIATDIWYIYIYMICDIWLCHCTHDLIQHSAIR